MQLYTIGFTSKTAEQFFGFIRRAGVATVVDVRLNNTSQLAGFSRRQDLPFFLRELCGADYAHVPALAPSRELLTAHRRKELAWPEFRSRYLDLLDQRSIEDQLDSTLLERGCLLCSEHEPHHCHRSLIADYLNDRAGLGLRVHHLY